MIDLDCANGFPNPDKKNNFCFCLSALNTFGSSKTEALSSVRWLSLQGAELFVSATLSGFLPGGRLAGVGDGIFL